MGQGGASNFYRVFQSQGYSVFLAFFPQLFDQSATLFPRFMILAVIFTVLSVPPLCLYCALVSRAKSVRVRPELSRWVSRVVGGNASRIRCCAPHYS